MDIALLDTIISIASPNTIYSPLILYPPSLPSPSLQKAGEHTISLVYILPRVLPAHHILHLLPLHLLALIVFLIDQEVIGAGATFESVLPGGEVVGRYGARDREGVGAVGTDCARLLVGA